MLFSYPLVLTNLQVSDDMADIAAIGQFAGSLYHWGQGSITLVNFLMGFLIGM